MLRVPAVSLEDGVALAATPTAVRCTGNGADCTVHAREGSEFLVVRASPAAGVVAVVDSGKQLALHRLSDGAHLSGRTLAKRVTALAFAALPTRDGATRHLLLVANAFGDVYAYPTPDVRSAERFLLGHCASSVLDLVLSPAGDRVCTADREEQVRVSDFPFAARMRHALFEHTKFVARLSVSRARPDLLLSVGGDGRMVVWRTSDGARVCGATLGDEARLDAVLSALPSTSAAESGEDEEGRSVKRAATGSGEGSRRRAGRNEDLGSGEAAQAGKEGSGETVTPLGDASTASDPAARAVAPTWSPSCGSALLCGGRVAVTAVAGCSAVHATPVPAEPVPAGATVAATAAALPGPAVCLAAVGGDGGNAGDHSVAVVLCATADQPLARVQCRPVGEGVEVSVTPWPADGGDALVSALAAVAKGDQLSNFAVAVGDVLRQDAETGHIVARQHVFQRCGRVLAEVGTEQ